MTTDHGDELGTDRSQRHWRLVSVQAGGGLTVALEPIPPFSKCAILLVSVA